MATAEFEQPLTECCTDGGSSRHSLATRYTLAKRMHTHSGGRATWEMAECEASIEKEGSSSETSVADSAAECASAKGALVRGVFVCASTCLV